MVPVTHFSTLVPELIDPGLGFLGSLGEGAQADGLNCRLYTQRAQYTSIEDYIDHLYD